MSHSAINSALEKIEAGEYRVAAGLLSEAPPCRDLHHTWGLLYLKIGQRREARAALERELASFSDNEPARRLLADLERREEAETLNVHDIPGIGLRSFYLRAWPSSDESVFDQIFDKGNYRPLIDLIESHGARHQIHSILDAGANIGCTALYLSHHFPDARILSVEPDPENFRQLERNLKMNRLENVSAIRAALWNGRAQLEIDPRFRDGREWARAVQERTNGDILGFSLQELLQKQRWDAFDLMKIDIEGAERVLFDESSSITPQLAATKFIAIEIHDEFKSRDRIEQILVAAGFELSTHEEQTIGVNRKALESPR